MTQQDLWDFVGRKPADCTTEWIEWATAVVESAPRPNNRRIRDEEASYLCRILWVLEQWHHDPTGAPAVEKGFLLSAFASGLALSNVSPDRVDGGLHFHRALDGCISRGLVRIDDHDLWHPGMASGAGVTDFVYLTPAGRKLAESSFMTVTSTPPCLDGGSPGKPSQDTTPNPAPTPTQASKQNTTPALATMITACTALHALGQIRQLYPTAIDDTEAKELYGQLVEAIEIWLDREPFESLKETYQRPRFENPYTEDVLMIQAVALMHLGGSQLGDLLPSEHKRTCDRLIRRCQKEAMEPVRSVAKRVSDVEVFNCRQVDPSVDPMYRDPRRTLDLLGKY